MIDLNRWFALCFLKGLSRDERLARWYSETPISDPMATAQASRCLEYIPRFDYLPCVDPRFPTQLNDLEEDAPLGLWIQGDSSALSASFDAIVGTRKATPAGLEMAAQAAKSSVMCGRWLVSGGAMGIDAAAHRAALPNTLSVMAGGLDCLTPPQNKTLFSEIAKQGALVSEMPPWYQPKPGLFPRRNRLIAALAQRVLVVEAELKSGSLITADWALKLSRDLYAVPGHPLYSGAAGTNQLLLDGAQFFLGPQDWQTQWSSPIDGGLVETLKANPLSISQLASVVGKDVSEVMPELIALQAKGLVIQRGGLFVVQGQ